MTDHLTPWALVPPASDVCQTCATDHDPKEPHNQQSLFYQYAFYREHGRWPTWADAVAHVEEPLKTMWIDALREKGITDFD